MIKCSFSSLDELKSFLSDDDFDEVKFCVGPDYVDAIIGLSDEGKIVYDYFKMVTHLAKIYDGEPECEDPEMDAMEWIDYNCDMPYWEIVTTDKEYWYGPLMEENFTAYHKYLIGPNMNGVLLIDSEQVNDQNVDDLEELLKNNEIEYKII